jgi:hypothetical protein
MEIKLTPDLLKTFAQPDTNGNIRATVLLKVNQRDGNAVVVSCNDVPVDPKPPEEEKTPTPEEGQPMAGQEQPEDMPSPGDVERSILGPA